MVITAIEPQKKAPNRASVFVDGEFAFGLDFADVERIGITVGLTLDEATYEKMLEETVFSKARDKALRLLEYRARSKKEICDKLIENEFGQNIIERVVAGLEKYGYIDDKKFAQMFISDKRRLNGFGKQRITHELTQKGVARNIIDECFNTLSAEFDEENADTFDAPDEETSLAIAALEKKYKHGFPIQESDKNDFFKEKNRAIQFLARKGFSFSQSEDAFSRFLNQT